MPRFLLVSCLAVSGLSNALAQRGSEYGQFAPPDAYVEDSKFAYYGSENAWNRRMFSAEDAQRDSKRMGQRLLLELLDGRLSQAVEMCEAQVAQEPDDLEAWFVLACAHAKAGRLEDASNAARQAVDRGLPVERFLAGPEELLEPLVDAPQFQRLAGGQLVRLVHGPMLGCVSERSIRVWMRTSRPADVSVRVFASESAEQPVATATGRTRPSADRTAVLTLEGLTPSTSYYYDVQVAGQAALEGRRFPVRTSPLPREDQELRVAFGGGAGYTPQYERMWRTIAERQPDALLQLGDNVYIDLPEQPGPFHRYTYYRRQSRPEYRRLIRTTPVYAIWDDHDAAIDDVWLGPYLDRPAWKLPTLGLFRQNWNNPSYGSKTAPGCWFSFTLGPIDVFMLDCRFYRTNPFRPQRTMLGPPQKEWLLNGLKQSEAEFKIIASSVPWSPGAKPGSHDTWDGFPEEREEIFRFLEDHGIDGVLLAAADRHRSDAWKINRPSGTPFYEVMSSRLTNIHTHECMPEAMFCYNETCSFGLLTFSGAADDRQVRYDIIGIDGEVVHSLSLTRSDLER